MYILPQQKVLYKHTNLKLVNSIPNVQVKVCKLQVSKTVPFMKPLSLW